MQEMAKGFVKKLLNWKIYCSSRPAHMVAHHGSSACSPRLAQPAWTLGPKTDGWAAESAQLVPLSIPRVNLVH
jgi:hypothetical protein